MGENKLLHLCRYISLYYSDRSWSRYLAEMADIREGIHLNRIGGKNPVLEFHRLAIEIFNNIQAEMENDSIESFKQIKNQRNPLEETGLKAPSATWTYLINDNPFGDFMKGLREVLRCFKGLKKALTDKST